MSSHPRASERQLEACMETSLTYESSSYSDVKAEVTDEEGNTVTKEVTIYQPNVKCPRLSTDRQWLDFPRPDGTSKLVAVPDTATWAGNDHPGTWEKKGPMQWVPAATPAPLPPFWSAWDTLSIHLKETVLIEKMKAEAKTAVKERKAMGWDKVHQHLDNLPRCRVHGTVCFFVSVVSSYPPLSLFFSFFSPYYPGRNVARTPLMKIHAFTLISFVHKVATGLICVHTVSFSFSLHPQPLVNQDTECWPYWAGWHFHVTPLLNGAMLNMNKVERIR